MRAQDKSSFDTLNILHCLWTKEYCEQKGTLEMFLYQDETFGGFSVKESRAPGLLSILIQGFNKLVQSCPIV